MKPMHSFGVVLLIGLAVGYLVGSSGSWFGGSGVSPKADQADRKILYWVAPMDPNYQRDEPGKSPMGMDLIPVYEGDDPGAGAVGSSVSIDPSVVNNIGVRTARAEWAALRPPINTVGRIMFDEERVAHIHLRSSGWIERLAVRSVGEAVSEGDLLLEVYSPDLVNAQAEYLQALRSNRTNLIEASRGRLRALGIADQQISAIAETKKPSQYIKVFAPINGVVTTLNGADGQFVKPETEIIVLADLSVVWLMSDVFEAHSGQLRIGAPVSAQSKFDPGRRIMGAVDYVYPDLDPITRTIPVRTVLNNPDGVLKPGMFMTVRIDGQVRQETTIIPREALIRTGREERVILAMDDGKFQPAAVVSGMEADGKIEILSGLNRGETVVASGQFLIDSESSFSGASLRLQAPAAYTPQAESVSNHEKDEAARLNNGPVEQPDSAHSQHDHSGVRNSEPPDAELLIGATGDVVDVRAADRVLKLRHDAIPELGWPSMTMDFQVDDEIDLASVQAGMRVSVSIMHSEDGDFVIRTLEVAQ
jgi:Cu(I)/Ag(I) efflux system membrane fusion protein